MAFFSIPKVKIDGIAACVPKHNQSNFEGTKYISAEEMQKISKITGVENRRFASKDVCTSDLCFESAEKLIEELGWDKSEIGVLVFISQTADYRVPMTSPILQDRLKLPTDCMCFDSANGCSGYVYGLNIAASLLSTSRSKKALLLVGDTSTKEGSEKDRSTFPLFGDAGTATAISVDDNQQDEMYFHMATDGRGYQAIFIPDGGSRNPITPSSFEYRQYEEGVERNNIQVELKGMDVFNFGITKAPLSVKKVLDFAGKPIEAVDYFVFHQANKLMNDLINKKLKISSDKVPMSLAKYGNTSSASIPITIVSELREKVTTEDLNFVFCGFGVGLSWGSTFARLNKIVCPPVMEL